MVWVWFEGEEMCWFAGILVLKGIGFWFGFAGSVGFAEGGTGSGEKVGRW